MFDFISCKWIKMRGNHRAYNRHIPMLNIHFNCQLDIWWGSKHPANIGRDLPQMGMEVFHGRNGNSGNSVVVSIGAHCHPGRSSWSSLYNLLSRAFSKSLPELCWGCTLPGFWWQVSHSPRWLHPCQRQILENVQGDQGESQAHGIPGVLQYAKISPPISTGSNL